MATTPITPGDDQLSDELRVDLARALDLDQFFLVYQPSIDLRTNGFAGVEALIRWRHPIRGIISPELFIDELETTGQIVEVGRWALISACEQGADWHDRGYRFAVSVNVSATQFASANFAIDVAVALASSRFDPALLMLEFAQDTILQASAPARARLSELVASGVRLAVDDFVPGQATLDDLQRLNIDTVKLARSFIAGIAASPDAASLVHELVALSKARGLRIIASGIENPQQRRQLQLEDITIGQGYLFSAPHEARDIDVYLEDFAIFSGKPL